MNKTGIGNKPRSLFFEKISAAQNRVLILDYDGTVAPFSRDRHRAYPYPNIPPLLHRIRTSCQTRIVVIAGRAAREVEPLLQLSPPPEIWGTHGLERLHPSGRYDEGEVSKDALRVLAECETRLDRAGLGALIELKLAGVAVHWRGLTESEILKTRTKAYDIFERLVSQDLVVTEFEEGVEMRLRNANKGTAVQTLLSEINNTGTPIAYLGDDIADEDAFRALNGRGLTVLISSKSRFTAAQLWLRPPDELIHFLTDWIHASGGES